MRGDIESDPHWGWLAKWLGKGYIGLGPGTHDAPYFLFSSLTECDQHLIFVVSNRMAIPYIVSLVPLPAFCIYLQRQTG